jgi:hypothetical protein
VSDLDDLASAARAPTTKTLYARRQPNRTPLVVGAVVAAALLVGGVSWLATAGSRAVVRVPDGAGGTRTVRVAAVAENADPGFSIESSIWQESLAYWKGWIVTNKSEKPLTVRNVVFNGEHVAALGEHVGHGLIQPLTNPKPLPLTIGSSQAYYQTNYYDESPQAYRKEVVFIDIETDRGTFRYRPDEGFVSR